MVSDPDRVRGVLIDRVDAWIDLEQKGAQRQASIMREDTLALARAFDDLTHDGGHKPIEFLCSLPPGQRRALRAARRTLSSDGWGGIRTQNYEQALAVSDRVESINRDLGSPYLQAGVHHLRGQAFHNLRRYRKAREQYEIARELYLQQDLRIAAAAVQSDLALLYADIGRLSEALRLYETVLAEQRRMLSLQHAAETLNHLGVLYVRMGDLSKGLEAHTEALTLERQIKDVWNQAQTLSNLGYVYYVQGDYQRAASLYREALAASQAAGRAPMISYVLNNLGELYFRTGNRQMGIEYLNKALKLRTDAQRSSYDRAWSLRSLGEIYLDMGKWDEAEYYIVEALKEAATSQTAPHQAILLATICNLQGRFFYKRGRFAEAAVAFGRALSGIEEKLTNLQAHHWKTSLLSSIRDLYDDAILLQRERLNNPEAAFGLAEKARARAFLDLIVGQIEFEYGDKLTSSGARRLRDVLSIVHADPLDWASLRQALPDELTVVEYTVTKDQLLIWVFDSGRLRSVAVPVSQSELKRRVQSFREAVTLGSRDFKQQFPTWEARLKETRARGAELYKRLIMPIKSLIPRDRLICLIPDDVLHYVPFGAMVDPGEQRYLIEEYSLFYAPSASILAWCLKRQPHQQAARPLLVVSNQEIGKDVHTAYPYLRPLWQAESFDGAITDMYRGAHLLKGAAASKSALLAAMPDYEIIHLSTHGILDDKEPLLSSLILAPRENSNGLSDGDREVVTPADGGQLFVHEIFQLKLPKTQLVTLSACETALGALWRGEGMVGMARAVFHSGVTSLVVTQWKIEDLSAGQLMASFYERLRTEPNIAKALTSAQLAYLQAAEHPRDRHPYYWGGFCLMGNYRLKVNTN